MKKVEDVETVVPRATGVIKWKIKRDQHFEWIVSEYKIC